MLQFFVFFVIFRWKSLKLTLVKVFRNFLEYFNDSSFSNILMKFKFFSDF